MNIQELNLLELNFEGMKRILTAPNDQSKLDEVKKEKQEQMAKSLKEQDFDELMKFTEPSVSFQSFLMKFLEFSQFVSFSARSHPKQAERTFQLACSRSPLCARCKFEQ